MGTLYTTERLVVRRWRLDEAPRLFDMLRRPEIARWTADAVAMQELGEATARIKRFNRRYPAGDHLGIWAMALPSDGIPLGTILVRPLPGTEDHTDLADVETGWSLHPDAHGRGYASEAARGAIRHAFAHGHERVWAIMWPDNDRSAAVCERAGMVSLGQVDDPWYGTADDPTSRMYRADRDQWTDPGPPPIG